MTRSRVTTRWGGFLRSGVPLLLPFALVWSYGRWARSAANPFFPPLDEMLAVFISTWGGAGLREHVLPSITNLSVGYAAGLVLGTLVGLGAGVAPVAWRAAQPVANFMLTIPAVALLPVFLLVFGVGQQLQIGIIAFAVFLHVLVTVASAVTHIEPVLLETVFLFRIRGVRRWYAVLLPAVLPQLIAAARVTLSIAVLVMVVSEIVGAYRGIGAMISLAQQSFDYRQMWAGMLLLALIGNLLNALFALGERRVLRAIGLELPRLGTR